MGLCSKDQISIVGNYLLAELKTKGTVRFSRFSGSVEAAEAWRRDAGLHEDENDDEGSADLATGYAIFQLADSGHISIRSTGEMMADGNSDDEISLTDKGKALVASGTKYAYRDEDPTGDVYPTLPWRPERAGRKPNHITGLLKLVASVLEITIAQAPFGVMTLRLGSTVMIFGKRPAGIEDPNDQLLRRELAIVQDGLSDAGAEQICHLVLGGVFLVLVKPKGIPLYEPGLVSAEQARSEQEQFVEMDSRLNDLVEHAHGFVFGRTGS